MLRWHFSATRDTCFALEEKYGPWSQKAGPQGLLASEGCSQGVGPATKACTLPWAQPQPPSTGPVVGQLR